MYLNAVHDLSELELESDLEQPLVLADGIGNAGLNSVSDNNTNDELIPYSFVTPIKKHLLFTEVFSHDQLKMTG